MSDNAIVSANNTTDGFICTVDLSTDEGKIAAANALNAAIPLKDYKEKTFTIVDVIQMPGKRAVSGTDCKNSYIILSDGTILFSQSDGIGRAIESYGNIWRNGFGDGLTVEVEEKPLANGNTMKTLRVVKTA